MADWSSGRKSCDWLLQSSAAELQKRGVALMLDCKWEEAVEVFLEGRQRNPSLAGAHCMVLLMRYLSSFEEEHKPPVLEAIRWAEEACGSPHGKFKKELRDLTAQNLEDDLLVKSAQLHLEISLGDCQICHAISSMLSMDFKGFVKGGWHLRKAWKLYEKSYREAKQIYDQNSTLLDSEGACTCEKSVKYNCNKGAVTLSDSERMKRKNGLLLIGAEEKQPIGDETGGVSATLARPRAETTVKSQNNCLRHSSQGRISSEELIRSEMVHQLLSSAAFGYGLFHLCISVLAPQVLKVVQFLGFPCDRQVGLSCLKFVSRSRHPMKSSIAALSLLWYHTVVRPFFALDLTSVAAGVKDAERILQRQPNAQGTVLYLFFRGRCERLKKELDKCLDAFQKALEAAGQQRELRLMCIYEIAWCRLLRMEWTLAKDCFSQMKRDSKWSPAYYAYLEGLCCGAVNPGGDSEVKTLFSEAISLVKRKNNPVEAFVAKRAAHLSKEAFVSQELAILYILEMVYLWRALQNAPQPVILSMLKRVQQFEEAESSSFHLSLECLVEGALLLETGDYRGAKCRLENAITLWENGGKLSKEWKHIPAFASYELACLLVRERESLNEGIARLERIKHHYKGYDFENRLSVRIHAALTNAKGQN